MTKRIYLCLAHMSGREMQYIQEAFDTNWVVPLGPNVNGFEADLQQFLTPNAAEDAPNAAEDTPHAVEKNHEAVEEDVNTAGEKAIDALEEDENIAGQGSNTAESGKFSAASGKSVVALSAGTAAVHLALVDLGIQPGDEVLCQSFTFCASANPIVYLGATPVFVDSEPDTWNMSPQLLEEAIADRIRLTGKMPKAIIPVHLYGMPAKMQEILAVAAKYDIPVVEDAAEAFGSVYDGTPCGALGQYGILSFNGNKMITTSGGGALVCPDDEAKQRVMFYATQAREAYPYYQHEQIGYNYRLSNICAGIGRGQMTIVREHIAHHRHVHQLYKTLLADMEGITVHDNPDPKTQSNFWLTTILLAPDLHVQGEEQAYAEAVQGAIGGAAGVVRAVKSATTQHQPNANVEALRTALDRNGIEARPLWKPMHLQPIYADSPCYLNGVSEQLFRQGLCLPSGPYVSDADVRYIVSTIKETVAQ